MRRLLGIVVCLVVPAVAAADTAPPPEVKAFDTQLALPPVPSFELPPAEPGFIDPKTLRVRGKKLLDTQQQVKGYIIWIYDCVSAVRLPKESKRQTQKRIDDDPTLCERAKLYLGEARDTPLERGVWVVDIPRPPNKLEKERLPKEELAAWPKVPRFKLGDYVVITGDFKIASPHNERNSDGLIVFASIAPAKRGKTAAAPVSSSQSASTSPARTIPTAPPEKPVDPKTVNAAVVLLNMANKSAGAKDFAKAAFQYRKALEVHPGLHAAWYGLGGALAQQDEWQSAREAFEHAVALRPDVAMYQMWSGIAAFEAAKKAARIAQAAQRGVKPEEVTVDLAAINFEVARDHLELALTIEPNLWRAHYYLGAIHRAADRAKAAAESFTRAIAADRRQSAPYIALGELYRKWDYPTQAIAVTELGTKELPAGKEASDVFYVNGMAYDDKQDFAHAIASFTRAIELHAENYKALFQRGQAYFKLKKWAEAKKDLELYVGTPAPLEFAKQQANTMLADIAGRAK